MGYWSALFFEDQNTWTASVADVCQSIVSYGVEIPWCVCSNSWSALAIVTDYLTQLMAFVSAFLHLDEWWCFEYSVLAFVLAVDVPFLVMKAKGRWMHLMEQLSLMFTSLGAFGCFMHALQGLQGGVLFGGKLFYPSLLVCSVLVQMVSITFKAFECELYGYGPVDQASKDSKFTKLMNCFERVFQAEVVFFMALAVFGLPKFEADPDGTTWLSVLPFLAMYKEMNDYYNKAEPVEANGEANKEKPAEKPVVPAKPAEAKKDEKKEEEVKKEASLLDGVCKGVNCIKGVFDCTYNRIRNLPWECITNFTLEYGTWAVFLYSYFALLEDVALVVAFPLICLGLPKLTAKLAPKLGKEGESFMNGMANTAFIGLQYYIFKKNIIQY